MHGVAWTPDVEYASALRAKLDHAMIAPGKITVSLTPFYATEHSAAEKLSAVVVLVKGGKDVSTLAAKAAVPAGPFNEQVTIPAGASGDYTVDVRLAAADGAVYAFMVQRP